MFIRGANSRAGTGYTGDVNTAFRQGRQDAFRDYIENFNFARQADAANNAENQANVQRIANNYAQQLQMNANGRNEVLDFVQKSDQIDGAVLESDINFAARDKLQPRVNEIADDRAREVFFTADSKANTAQTDAVKSTYGLQNAGLENEVYVAGQQSQLNKNQYDAATTAGKLEGYQLLKNEMDNFSNPENVEKRRTTFLDRTVAIAKQNGDQRSDAEIRQAIMNHPDYDNNFRQYSQDEFSSVSAKVAALGNDLSGATQAVGGGVPQQRSTRQTQQTQTKEQKADTWRPGATKYIKVDDAKGLIDSSVDLGNGFRLTPDGSIAKVLQDGRAMVIPYKRKDGAILSVDEARRIASSLPNANTSGVTAEQVGNSFN